MNKVASGTIRAKTHTVVGPTQICLVFGVSGHCAKFSHTVGKLAFFTIFTSTVLRKGAAQFGLVAAGVDLGGRGGGGGAGGGGAGGAGVTVVSVVDFVSQTF